MKTKLKVVALLLIALTQNTFATQQCGSGLGSIVVVCSGSLTSTSPLLRFSCCFERNSCFDQSAQLRAFSDCYQDFEDYFGFEPSGCDMPSPQGRYCVGAAQRSSVQIQVGN